MLLKSKVGHDEDIFFCQKCLEKREDAGVIHPSVTAVCLYADRPQFIPQILRSFRSQTYSNKSLIIYDNGQVSFEIELIKTQMRSTVGPTSHLWDTCAPTGLRDNETLIRDRTYDQRSIGRLRNVANSATIADIIWTLDSDDLSTKHRMSEQVALLQSSGAEVVGYNEVVFWRDLTEPAEGHIKGTVHQDFNRAAYLYANSNPKYAIGGSLCYRREFWQRKPFRDLPKPNGGTAEDNVFIAGENCIGVSGIVEGVPRLVCRIHGSNTSNYDSVLNPSAKSHNWRRVADMDAYCARVMATEVAV